MFKQEEKKVKPEDKDSEEERDSQSIENQAWKIAELDDEVTEDQSLRILFKEAEAEEPISLLCNASCILIGWVPSVLS